jgi:hypothetical protein
LRQLQHDEVRFLLLNIYILAWILRISVEGSKFSWKRGRKRPELGREPD